MTYKVSVIIPTYNAEKFIENTINSVINQTIGFENIELIIVDDNSSDSTKDILKKYTKFPNVKCIFQETNTGSPSVGRNIGINNASSDYVMFLDNDDMYIDSICEVLYDAITKTNVNIVMCNHYGVNLTKDIDISNLKKQNDTSITFLYPKKNFELFGKLLMWDKIFRLDFLKKHNIKCPEGYFREDIYFCIKAYLNTDKVVLLENYCGYLYNLRYDADNSSSSNTITKKFLLNNLESEYFSSELLKKNGNQEIINYYWGFHVLPLFFSWFIALDESSQTKIEVLNELYDCIIYSNFDGKVDGIIWHFFYKNIKRKNFTIILFLTRIMNFIYHTPIKDLRRKIIAINNK